MKNLKPYKTTESSVLYRVARPAQVTQALVTSVDWPVDKRGLCFDFKSVKLDPSRPLCFKLSPKYSVRIACYSPGRGIKVPAKPATLAGIEVRPPKNLVEHKKITLLHDTVFLRMWRRKISPEAVENYSADVLKKLHKAKSLIAFRKNKPVGVFSHMPHKGVSGKTYDAVFSWTLFPGLSPAERRSASYQCALWLKKTARRQVSVSLGLFEKDAIKFFAEAGFTSCRVILERLSGIKKK